MHGWCSQGNTAIAICQICAHRCWLESRHEHGDDGIQARAGADDARRPNPGQKLTFWLVGGLLALRLEPGDALLVALGPGVGTVAAAAV